jgi:hypothetical protein
MRLLVRLVAALLGAALVVVGVLLALEVFWAWVRPDQPPLLVPWPQLRVRLAGHSWQDRVVIAWAAAPAAAGLALTVLSLLGRRHDVLLHDPATAVTASTSPRSVARFVGQRVRATDGVVSASVIVGKRRVRVRAVSRLLDEQALQPRLMEQVSSLVQGLPLVRPLRVDVVVASPRDRR